MALYVFMISSILWAIGCYFGYDWSMRGELFDFKRFPVKAQRIMCGVIHIIYIIPAIIIKIIKLESLDAYMILLILEMGTFLLYLSIMSIICHNIAKIKRIKEKIIALHLADSTDYSHVKAELKSWYDISATAKQIEKAQQQIREDLSKKEKE